MKRTEKITLAPKEIEFFVSPDGNDAWSGRRGEPARGGRDGPFATVERARKAVRDLKKGGILTRPARVTLREGRYFLRRPLTLDARDGGSPSAPITWAGFEGERPVISGGRRIENWTVEKLNGRTVWVSFIPEVKSGRWYFKQLFVNGARRSRTRLPAHGFYRVAKLPGVTKKTRYNVKQDSFVFKAGDLRAWKNPGDVEIVAFHFWVASRMGVKAVDEKKRTVFLDRPSISRLTDCFQSGKGAPYCVENVFEALKTPGQWYLERKTGKLFYLPLPGESPETAEVIAPVLSQVLKLSGTAKQKVQYVSLENLTFSHTQWDLPRDSAGFGQAAVGVPGAVVFENAECCALRRSAVEHVGTYGVEVKSGTMDIDIAANELADLGAGGVIVRSGSSRNHIERNHVHHVGQIYHEAVAVIVMDSGGNEIVHNHIHHTFYTGISAGWKWGYMPSAGFGNIIEYNHIHDIGQGILSDMGGIYTLGVSTGTRLRYNLIHDVNARTYGGWGIYLDEGSADMLVENNLVYRTNFSGFHQHYGRDNIVQNNIFALGRHEQVARGRVEPHNSFTFRRNIVYYREGKTFGANFAWYDHRTDKLVMLKKKDVMLRIKNVAFRDNLYFNAARKPLDFMGFDFKRWRALGYDTGSLVADPLFVSVEKADFRLRRGSPAQKLGFIPFDLSQAGL